MQAYLVVISGEPADEFWPLEPGQRLTIGRSPDNHIVLPDELCSRHHAELVCDHDGWSIRDLRSRNGVRVNGELIRDAARLALGDRIRIGQTELLLTDELPQHLADKAPDLSRLEREDAAAEEGQGPAPSITARLGRSRFISESDSALLEDPRLARDLTRLFRLGLDMGAAADVSDLCNRVIDGLLECTHADTGAVLMRVGRRGLKVLAHRGRDTYSKVSDYISDLVLRENEAILARDVSADQRLRNRQSIEEIGAESLVCAPIREKDRVVGLIHLYSTDPTSALDRGDLEFTLAVAHQFSNMLAELRQRERLAGENKRLRESLRLVTELVGESDAIKRVREQIARVAPTSATVLIRGESGVGKELVARAIHANSPRSNGPIVCLNCAALTETLLESELFGHEKGAFTGATEQRIGKFEAANGGVIFLDEIGELNPSSQAKLLRVLEGQPFERVGGNKPITVDVRVIAATNIDLEDAVRNGKFRRDLYFRLNVVEIFVPPLRDRKEDIPILAKHFLEIFTREIGRRVTGFTEGAMRKLMRYDWPGNVRELKNVIERAVVLGTSEQIREQDILLSSLEPTGTTGGRYRPISLEQLEREHIAATLAHTGWNKSQAAAILGIERSTLDRKINRYGLKR